jgi:hypothetical protein
METTMPLPDLLPFDEFSRHPGARRRWPARLAVATAAAALTGLAVLAGCGGGGGDSGSSAAAGTSSGTTTSGSTAPTTTATAATAYTEGTITGFGSVIVNGVRFDDSSCTVVDDSGTTTTASALKLGMRVEVSSGDVDNSAGTAKAVKVAFGSRVLGPVAAVGTTTLTVLGQTIDIVDATVFDNSSLPNGLASVAAGTVVEVHGLPDSATGHILATRIEAVTGATAYKLRGAITALDTAAKTLSIGATAISYGSATLSPSTLALATGLVVRITLPTTIAGQPYAASTVSVPGRLSSSTTTTTPLPAHVRGTVASYSASAKTFTLDGLKVDASGVTTLPTGLADGVEVDVTGSVSNSVLVATAVTLKAEARGKDGKRFELHGAITAIDTTAKTFTLRGLTVDYSGVAASAVTPSTKTLADLAVGAKVEVQGTVNASRTQVLATAIQFES